MAFIQIIEFRTKDVEALSAVDRQYEEDLGERGTFRRSIIARDRNDPERHYAIVFFDSYESAMVNSELPETQAVAGKMASLIDGEPIFHDFDVIEDRRPGG